MNGLRKTAWPTGAAGHRAVGASQACTPATRGCASTRARRTILQPLPQEVAGEQCTHLQGAQALRLATAAQQARCWWNNSLNGDPGPPLASRAYSGHVLTSALREKVRVQAWTAPIVAACEWSAQDCVVNGRCWAQGCGRLASVHTSDPRVCINARQAHCPAALATGGCRRAVHALARCPGPQARHCSPASQVLVELGVLGKSLNGDPGPPLASRAYSGHIHQSTRRKVRGQAWTAPIVAACEWSAQDCVATGRCWARGCGRLASVHTSDPRVCMGVCSLCFCAVHNAIRQERRHPQQPRAWSAVYLAAQSVHRFLAVPGAYVDTLLHFRADAALLALTSEHTINPSACQCERQSHS